MSAINYPTQLKTWAVEKALTYKSEIGDVIAFSDKLIEYAYSPDQDLQDCVTRLQTLIKTAEAEKALQIVSHLLLELGMVQEDIERQLNLQKAVNAQPATEVKQ